MLKNIIEQNKFQQPQEHQKYHEQQAQQVQQEQHQQQQQQQFNVETSGEYSSYDVRLQSFYTWSMIPNKPTPKALAAAGFYYDSNENQTICHQGGLRIWNWGDFSVPIEQHTKFNIMCPFIQNNYCNVH